MEFEQAVEIILKHEGGYSNDPLDPGMETNFGISKRAYPNEDIKNMTRDRAKEIYLMDYWHKCSLDKMPPQERLMFFDCAVNQGPARAKGMYHLAISLAKGAENVTGQFAKLRLDHYKHLPGWPRFGAGWATRLLNVTIAALTEGDKNGVESK